MVIIINTVLAFFLASQPIGTNSPFKGLFTRISDPNKAVFEANQSAQSVVVLSGESQRNVAETFTSKGNLHIRGHPVYPPLGCW